MNIKIIKIKSIKLISKEEHPIVYDIQVKDNNNFFANNLLVHNCVVIDEAHRTEDVIVAQRILPMLSFSISKMIKIGVPAGKNNFWKSCTGNTGYTVLKKNWLECPKLCDGSSFFYNGIEYPRKIVNKLPLSVKQRLFPDRPDLHFEGDLSELEFKTQYDMEWVSDIYLELNEENQARLVSGTHSILTKGLHEQNEEYFFGLDTAGGSLLPGKKDLDFTALSIWRKRGDGVKEKVACFEWRGDVINQWDEIEQIIHPETGLFHCKFGLADHSNTAVAFIPIFQKKKIPIDGILFGHTEPASGKNFKNAMFDQFKYELENNRIKFPSTKTIDDSSVVFKKSLNEWCNLERYTKMGINCKIEAPSDLHDDSCCADVLACWSMDKTTEFKTAQRAAWKIPKPQGGQMTTQSPLLYQGNPKGQENRYLR